jgi:hypothetical protein
MKSRRLFVTALVLTCAVAGIVLAQDVNRATVLLRSGERITGELEDVDKGTVYVRVTLHDQRKIPVSEVVLIDFVGGASGLPETELSVAREPDDLALLRSGQSMRGEFVDIRGGEDQPNDAEALIFRVEGREQRIPIDQVARIYLGEFPPRMVGAAEPGGDAQVHTVRVPANQRWVPTPLTVRKGERIVIEPSGQIQLSNDSGDVAQPEGSLKRRYADDAPLERVLAGALIGRVGDSEPFPIGRPTEGGVPMPADGRLFLGVNDDYFQDNRGEFVVRIRRQ